MITQIVRYTCMNFCIFFMYQLFINKKTAKSIHYFTLSIISFFVSMFFYFIPASIRYVAVLFQLVSLFIFFVNISFESRKTIFFLLILSYSISYLLYFISGIFISIIYAITTIYICDIHTLKVQKLQWFTCTIQCLLCYMLMHLKKIKNNLPYVKNYFLIRIGTCISLLVVVVSMFESTKVSNNSNTHDIANIFYLLGVALLLIFSFLLYIWWNTMSHQAYLLKAKERENERLTNELEFYKAKLQEYQQEHEKLARLIHRDNKLIPSLQYSVQELLLQAVESEDIKLVGLAKELSSQLKNEKCSRKLEIEHLLQKPENFPATKIIGVDQYLLYFYHECHKKNIQFTCNLEADLSSIFSTRDDFMTVKEFCTLLSDLLENAKIAISYSNTSENYIHLFIGWTDEHLVMEISDSGIPFTKETLFHYGETKYTTHKKDGGSGIGIMETWKLLKKQQASLLIDESISLSKPFTKKIILTFDGCNRYELYPSPSRMETDLEYLSDRNDLKIRR